MKAEVRRHFRAMTDFRFFCTEVLGYRESDEFGYVDLCEENLNLCDFLVGGRNSKLVLMPRHSFKSAICTCGWVLWRLVREPNSRVLIYSDSISKAQGFLQDIKNHIEGKAPNSDFMRMYPDWVTQSGQKGCWGDGKWNDSEIVIKARTVGIREPSIDTGGIDQSKVGKHYDIVVFDDIVSDQNTTTKMQMDKVYACYKKSLSLLKPGGETLIVGTRWSYGDAYGRIIDDNRSKENFDLLIRSAEVNGSHPFEAIGLDKRFLEAQKRDQGSALYSCLYLNAPANAETAIFEEKNFRFYKPCDGFHENMYITGAVDPAGEGEDKTAITVVGTNHDRRMFVLDAVNRRMQPHEIISEIIRLNYRWGFHRVSVERNFFHGTLEKDFRSVEEPHRANPHYRPFSFAEDIVSTSANRNFNRILGLQPFHERGDIQFPNYAEEPTLNTLPEVFRELADQMLMFTIDGSKSPRDDLIVSLSFHVEIVRCGGKEKEGAAPWGSAKWFEEKQIEEMSRSGLPMRYRQTVERAF